MVFFRTLRSHCSLYLSIVEIIVAEDNFFLSSASSSEEGTKEEELGSARNKH